jgi:hypothetical protein
VLLTDCVGAALASGTAEPDLEQLSEKCYRWPRGGPRRGNARHRPMHAATRLPPAGPPEAHAEISCRRRSIDIELLAFYGLNNGYYGRVAGRTGDNARPKHAAAHAEMCRRRSH